MPTYSYLLKIPNPLSFRKMNLLSTLCIVLVIYVVVISARPCSNTGFFNPNSTYGTNRDLVLSSIIPNVRDFNGYYNLSVGQGTDRVYGVGMCIPGAEAGICSDCIEEASERLQQSCPNQTEAFTWSGAGETLCMVRYSNHSDFGSLNMEPSTSGYNGQDITSNLTEFDQIWKELSLHTLVSASKENDTLLSDQKYYAAEFVVWTTQNIYSLMQCTPDLSQGNCKTCLEKCVDDYQDCCHGKRGGYVYRPSCIFRWDLYPFNGAFDHFASTVAQPPRTLKPSVSNRTFMAKEGSKKISKGIILAISVLVVVIVVILFALGFTVRKMRKSHQSFDHHSSGTDISSTHSLQFDYKTIETATNKFSESNKIGCGGSGEVFKGVLLDGTQVAVKRLEKTSGQSEQEFKNEAILLTKLQHRNLVRLLGFVLKGDEKILVYEFVPNKSLDYFLFDPLKQGMMDWTTRYNIIGGIARGVLYLHQDSRLIIIHRDLKASNILLDVDMNPKIADFGIARIFGMDQTRAETRVIVGTYGYMSPEYAMQGHFSMKSDVYSFGVLVLEIISGKKTSRLDQTDGNISNLVTHAWRLWRDGSPFELVDSAIGEIFHTNEATRCIHIALLCVQEDPAYRPSLPSIILMLTSNTITLPLPQQPGFLFQSRLEQEVLADGLESTSTSRSVHYSVNEASMTDLEPR